MNNWKKQENLKNNILIQKKFKKKLKQQEKFKNQILGKESKKYRSNELMKQIKRNYWLQRIKIKS